MRITRSLGELNAKHTQEQMENIQEAIMVQLAAANIHGTSRLFDGDYEEECIIFIEVDVPWLRTPLAARIVDEIINKIKPEKPENGFYNTHAF